MFTHMFLTILWICVALASVPYALEDEWTKWAFRAAIVIDLGLIVYSWL